MLVPIYQWCPCLGLLVFQTTKWHWRGLPSSRSYVWWRCRWMLLGRDIFGPNSTLATMSSISLGRSHAAPGLAACRYALIMLFQTQIWPTCADVKFDLFHGILPWVQTLQNLSNTTHAPLTSLTDYTHREDGHRQRQKVWGYHASQGSGRCKWLPWHFDDAHELRRAAYSNDGSI